MESYSTFYFFNNLTLNRNQYTTYKYQNILRLFYKEELDILKR